MKRIFGVLTLFLLGFNLFANDFGSISGLIVDEATQEPIMGASIQIEGTSDGTISDLDGNFTFSKLPIGTYGLIIKYVSYATITVRDILVEKNKTTNLGLEMQEEAMALEGVVVVARAVQNNELAMLNAQRVGLSIQSGVSAQMIAKTQDRDASEVIKRIPGISIIDGRFVMIRGLAQRYNNVWVNNGAVPSSEADSRAFNFDIIPSSQLDNIMIVKIPTPELPADFAGGFVKVNTKDVPSENSVNISVGTSFNEQTHFQDFKKYSSSGTDYLGFDSSRKLPGGMMDRLDNNNEQAVDDISKNGFNDNAWIAKHFKPLGDIRLNASVAQRFNIGETKQLALIGSVNYSNTYKTIKDMENNRFGIYDVEKQEPVYIYKYVDNIYTQTSRLGAMLNLTFIANSRDRYEFKNIFNQVGQSRYTEREGYQNISAFYKQDKQEYSYHSRSTYNAQFTGNHNMDNHKIDWSVGYAYTNKDQPDRKIISREENAFVGDPNQGKLMIDQNEISRDFARLDEHIASVAGNYDYKFFMGNLKPTLKAGVYGEFRTRQYKNRSFTYQFNESNLPSNFKYLDPTTEILTSEYLGANQLYAVEDTDNRNSYGGNNVLGAVYVGLNLPINRFNLYAGVRAEFNQMSITSYTRISEWNTNVIDYPTFMAFPSFNGSYKIDERNQLRLGYGMSVNRPEFRELSTFVYYDFDLFGFVAGNPDLKETYIQNVDLRYEFYPTASELISAALFYKNFKNPIEWTYRDAGGTFNYLFVNAESANSAGIEIDIKKNLDFMGMRGFSFNFNGAYIISEVLFGDDKLEKNRAMQGQSPYLINAGIFYQNDKWGFSGSMLYNIIGPRIMSVGRTDIGGNVRNDLPDSYEMPRHTLDLNLSQKFAKRWEVRLSIRDIIAQPIVYKQFPKYYDENGVLQTKEQIQRTFNPGRTFYLTFSVKI